MSKNARTCPVCGADSYVVDTRINGNDMLTRKRECQRCGKTWRTLEIRIQDMERGKNDDE